MTRGAHARTRSERDDRAFNRSEKKRAEAARKKASYKLRKRLEKQQAKAEKIAAKEERKASRAERKAFKKAGKDAFAIARGPNTLEQNRPVQSKREAKPTKTKQSKKPRISAQATLPFEAIGSDGTVLVGPGTYSRIIKFGDVDYKLARREDREVMFERWCEILNSVDASIGFDLFCVNRRPSGGELASMGDISRKNDGLDPIRTDLSEMLSMRAAAASGGLVKEHFIAFSIKVKSYREARGRLAAMESKLTSGLHTLGVRCDSLTRSGVITLLARQCGAPVPSEQSLSRHLGIDPKDIIAPTIFDFGHADWYRAGLTYKRASWLQINPPRSSPTRSWATCSTLSSLARWSSTCSPTTRSRERSW